MVAHEGEQLQMYGGTQLYLRRRSLLRSRWLGHLEAPRRRGP